MHLDLSHKVDRKKILLVLSGTFQPNAGMFEYGKAWISLLLREGWEVGICGVAAVLQEIHEPCAKFEIPGEYDSGSKFYKAISMTSLIDAGSAKRFKHSILRHIEIFRPSVVHITDRTLYTGYLLKAIAMNNSKITTTCTIHDPKRHEEKISRLAKLLVSYDDNRIAKAASLDNVILHVHSYKLVRHTIFDNLTNIVEMPHPLPNAIVKRTRREIIGKESYPIRLGFLGRIEPYKGLDVFYEAIASCFVDGILNSEHIEIIIAGRGQIEHSWESLPCNVQIINSLLSDQEFHQLMADIDLLILPYKTATQSGVGMLALTYGIPVIVTRVGALDQLIIEGETGYFIDPENVKSLAQTTCRLVNSPEKLAQIRKNCLKHTYAKYE